jgi:adenine-specific DNA-methyltransferase
MSKEIDGKSLDIKAEKLEQLKALFPEFFSEGKIDLTRIKHILGDEEITTPDHYELSWAGKAEARREIQTQTTATLIPDHEGSINFDTSENIFIEGENLEVLRTLQKSYFGRVKMIYIDPPYNTGNDSFIYPDDYAERKAEYEKRTGRKNGEGYLNKLDLYKKNTKENGQYHSVWLSMMYPRLYLARNLLAQDGVIFVSIDDNEQTNLKQLMDEIYGQENFVVQIIWKKRSTPPNDKIIGANHEYILVYAKNLATSQLNLKERTQEQLARYQNPDNHPKGAWTSGDLMANVKGGRYVASLYFPIINPNTGEEHYPSSNGNWRFNSEKIKRLIDNKEIFFGEDGKGRPKLKRFLSDVKEGVTYPSIWDFVAFNAEGSSEMATLLGNMNIFDSPKPSKLLVELLSLGLGESDIVLDFFAGSGTTAQAVLELNEKDGGNRQFICVQMPEVVEENSEAYKAGYKTIADICKARIKKVIETIRNGSNGKMEFAKTNQDLGFRSYKLYYSNFKKWKTEIIDKEDLLKQLAMFKEPLAQQPSDSYDLLVELLLKSGIPLSANIEKRQTSDNVPYYIVDSGRAIYALDSLSDALLKEVEETKPKAFITLGNLFTGEKADEQMTNWKLQLKESQIEFKVI